MAVPFADLARIADLAEFQQRVSLAMGVAAAAVYAEAPSLVGNSNGTASIALNPVGISPGMLAAGPGVQPGAFVLSVNGTASVTLSSLVQGTLTGATFSFALSSHAARALFANKVANGNYQLKAACLNVLGQGPMNLSAVLATQPGNNIVDSDIQTAVNALWSLMAGA